MTDVPTREIPPSPAHGGGVGGGGASTTTATLTAVVVSYNRRDLVARCLDSLLSDPEAPSLEVIVVDNASQDGAATMLAEQYPGVRVIANDVNVGYGRACNQGLAVAQGRYLLVLNQDIVVRPGSLAALVRFADEHPDAGLVGARLEYEDGRFQHSAF
ncbi:MAG: glycosyltransferase family 2 protein, partial [Chloroflexota bacterium]